MNNYKYVIIGNSAAGLSAVSSIRNIDKDGEILIVTEEDFINYSKPLITYLLAGRIKTEEIYFKDRDFYSKNNVVLKTNFKVEKIDFKNKKLFSQDRKEISYEKILISSGGSPIIPGIEIFSENDSKEECQKSDNFKNLTNKNYKDIEGIFTFTTIKDSLDISNYLKKSKSRHAVILGGGLIGLKAAEAFLELGLKVSIIELSDRVLSASFDKDASAIIEREISDKKNSIHTKSTIKKIFVKNNRINSIELENGQCMDCSLLVIAVGVKPDLSIFTDCKKDSLSIETKKGILTDRRMQTSVKDVYAAGDVVESFDLITGASAPIAVWPLAVRQGFIAGSNMAGSEALYEGGYFMNSVEILSIPSITIGITNLGEKEDGDYEIIKDLRSELKTYKKIVIKNNMIVGIILVGNIERAGIYGGLIKNKIDISQIKTNLIKEDFGVIELPNNYKKHLVVGDGIEV